MSLQTIETNSKDKLILDSQGARIQLWLQDELVLTKIERGDGKIGSTHPCTPIFGPDRNNLYGLAQHGNMRNELVNVNSQTENEIKFNYEVIEANYPHGMEVSQKLNLTNNLFKLEMVHTNKGNVPMAVNSGEHCYFDAPKGFEGTFINDLDITEVIQNHKDGVAIKLERENLITIPGKSSIKLTQVGFNFAMLWVGTNPDLTKKDKNYVCIEPVEIDPNLDYFGSVESMIQPGNSRTNWFSLALNL